MESILQNLNPAQREAVTYLEGPLLVLAGAGSGKTRVLTHRIAYLMGERDVRPWHILAVTFTNKAAGEMRGRIEQLLGIPAAGLWVGTFHGIAHRLLRAHWKDVDLPQTFQIMDSEDQLRAVRRVVREMGLDEEHWSPREVQWFINARKDEGLRPQHLEHHNDPWLRHMIAIYENADFGVVGGVAVQAVPEPSAIVLAMVGIGAVAVAMRRRRASGWNAT